MFGKRDVKWKRKLPTSARIPAELAQAYLSFKEPVVEDNMLTFYYAIQAEGHIQQFCKERGLNRKDITLIHSTRTGSLFIQWRGAYPKPERFEKLTREIYRNETTQS